jgi:asparagine synthase (glutamine-hydrolysing)
MTAFEAAVGVPVGLDAALVLPEVDGDPLTVLEDVVADALRRPPCCVAFSGGRDSSLLLAAAVRSAERHGHDQPVAVTACFPGAPATVENRWQRLVLDHLGIDRHVTIDVIDELDLVGTVAQAELRRRGALFPANCHGLAPLLEHAAGGTLLVGLGGDELLDGHAWTRLNDALAGRRRPTLRDAGRLASAALPSPVRARLIAWRRDVEPPRWLRPAAAARLRALERVAGNEPVRFDDAVRQAVRARTLVVAAAGLKRLSQSVRIEAPLLDKRFVAALSRAGGARGFGDRVHAMRAITGDVLPDELLDRMPKAAFDAVYFGDASRSFAERWSGGGLDAELVDSEALRGEWLQPIPDFRSALPLQLAWLHDDRRHG